MICVPFARHNLKLCIIFFFITSMLDISGTNFKSTGTNFQINIYNSLCKMFHSELYLILALYSTYLIILKLLVNRFCGTAGDVKPDQTFKDFIPRSPLNMKLNGK